MDFLEANPENAYSIDEICVGVEGIQSDTAMWLVTSETIRRRILKRYVSALHALVAQGRIVVARVGETQYFALPTE